MGHNIQVGDKVRLTGADWYGYTDGVTVGTIVEVTGVDEDGIFAGDADSVGNEKGLYSKENSYGHTVGDYSVELVTPKMRFDVGDEVYDASSAKYGSGHIIGVRDGYYRVRFHYAENNGHYSSQGDAHTRKEDEVTQDCVEDDCLCRDKESVESRVKVFFNGADQPSRYTETTHPEFVAEPPVNAVNPNHYKFPNGAEVIDIVRNLDFLTGNAIKYLARAGRKGSKREDLEKALKYVEWALEDVDDVPG